MGIKVLSLFDGISCGRVALDRADISVDSYKAFEIDEYAVQISKKNYPDIVHCGNVFDGDFSKYRGYDLLLGGSPCTYWSCAKTNRETTPDGFGGRLFMEYVRALKESGCTYFLYENNNSIHQDIKDFISEQLGVKPIMINSALVSAQQRKRCYWTNIPSIEQPRDRKIYVENIVSPYLKKGVRGTPVLYDDFQTFAEKPVCIGKFGKGGQGQRIYSVKGKSVTMTANGGGRGARTGMYKIYLPDGGYVIRKLTPLEAERLQTLPDNYTDCRDISSNQRYKCIGNGWTVDVISHILKNLKEA